LIFLLFENCCEPVEDLGSFRCGRAPPFGGGLLGGGDRLVDIGRIRFGEPSDDVARVGGIDVQEPTTRRGRQPPAIDEIEKLRDPIRGTGVFLA